MSMNELKQKRCFSRTINIISKNMIGILFIIESNVIVMQFCLSSSMIGTPIHVGDIDAMMIGIDYNVSWRCG